MVRRWFGSKFLIVFYFTSTPFPDNLFFALELSRRVALHKYDPLDLVVGDTFTKSDADDKITKQSIQTPVSERIQQLEYAASIGLLVDFGQQEMPGLKLDVGSPFSVNTNHTKRSLAEECHSGRSLCDDSDDDLL